VKPVGSPNAARFTAPAKLLTELTVTVNWTVLASIAVAGLETGIKLMVKSGATMVVGSLPELGGEPPPVTLTWLVSGDSA
jgi:predicted Co/Zn/Cd cation transporter (cation efflux family)